MKKIVQIIIFIAILSSCTETPPQLTYEGFDLNIDSVYNITATSATLRAKLKIFRQGNVPLSSIYVAIKKVEGNKMDTLSREVNFKYIAPTVTLTIDSLRPNTLYYVTTGGRYNPPDTEEYKWVARILGIESPYFQSFYTLPLYTN